MVTTMTSATALTPPGTTPPAKPARVALHMEVTAVAAQTFDSLAAELGMSRPRLFAHLMARQAQQMRLEADLRRMREDGRGDADPGLSEWLATNGVGTAA